MVPETLRVPVLVQKPEEHDCQREAADVVVHDDRGLDDLARRASLPGLRQGPRALDPADAEGAAHPADEILSDDVVPIASLEDVQAVAEDEVVLGLRLPLDPLLEGQFRVRFPELEQLSELLEKLFGLEDARDSSLIHLPGHVGDPAEDVSSEEGEGRLGKPLSGGGRQELEPEFSSMSPPVVEPSQVFRALSDPTRRAILELLRGRGRPAGEIASAFLVSRPAISRHLRVLRQGALVPWLEVCFPVASQGAAVGP